MLWDETMHLGDAVIGEGSPEIHLNRTLILGIEFEREHHLVLIYQWYLYSLFITPNLTYQFYTRLLYAVGNLKDESFS